jgi:hypothetical protein
MNINVKNEFSHGQVSVTTTPTAMASYEIRHGITILALSTNTQIVYVGNSDAMTTSTGFPLAAGSSILIPVDNADKIFLRSASGTQVISFIVS